jgi:hypothetical protein
MQCQIRFPLEALAALGVDTIIPLEFDGVHGAFPLDLRCYVLLPAKRTAIRLPVKITGLMLPAKITSRRF